MTKFEFVSCFLTLIGVLVASAMIYSDRFAGRMDANKKIYTVLATTLTVLAALSVAVYVDFIHYGEFVLWRFCLTAFSVFSITIGMSVISAMFKVHRDDRKEYREHKKLTRETEKLIRDTKASMRRDGCMITDHNAYSRADKCMAVKGGYMQVNDTYTVKENLALKSNCCEMVGGKVISFEEARKKRR